MPATMKLLDFPETRQVFNFDCGANALVRSWCSPAWRSARIGCALAGTTKAGTSTEGILRVLRYYGLPFAPASGCGLDDLRRAIDDGYPTLVTLQAYREIEPALPRAMGRRPLGRRHRLRQPAAIYYEDPSAFHRTWLADEELRQRWHDVDRGNPLHF